MGSSYQPARTPAQIADRDEARAAKLEALHATLAEQITALRSGTDWQKWLSVAARFHQYSFNNVTLIAAQCHAAGRPAPTAVAGFARWKALGRQVNKGERAIAILAPVVHRSGQPQTATEDEPTTATRTGPDHSEPEPVTNSDGRPRRRPSRQRPSFRIAHVFDISQTSGTPLPERPAPQFLAGQAPEGLWQALAEQVVARGFTLEREDCGTANGVTDYVRRRVCVRPDLDDAAAVKTLSHELAHVLLHDPTGAALPTSAGVPGVAADPAGTVAVQSSSGQCRGRIEVEAESVAYLITASHGLESSAYTFPYVAGWAVTVDAVTPETVVRATGERVLIAARIILAATEHLVVLAAATASHLEMTDQNLDATTNLDGRVDPAAPDTTLVATSAHTDQAARQLPSTSAGLTTSSPSSSPASSPRSASSSASPSPERLMQVHELAVAFYTARLHADGPEAQRAAALLAERGVPSRAVLDARLGYAPRAWTALVDQLRAAGVDDQELLASGLVVQTSRGTLVDRFRDRLIFPVQTEPGRTVALLGRTVDSTATDRNGAPVPRYLNSPETTIYRKGEVLYGLAPAATALRNGATPVLVEGPMDVLAVNHAGRETSAPGATWTPAFVGVAPCGTALTADQVTLLDQAVGGLAERSVVTAFDGDHAGRAAGVRAFALLCAVGAWPDTVAMPAGQDPALLLQQHGPGQLLAALHAAAGRPLAEVVIDERIDRYADQLRWAEGRISAARAAAGVIATLPAEQVGRQVARLAGRLDLPMATVTDLVVEAATSPTHRATRPGPARSAEHTLDPSSARAAAAPLTAAQRANAGFPVSLQSSLRPPSGSAASDVSRSRAELAAPVPEYRPRSA